MTLASADMGAEAYPVTIDVQPDQGPRNRLTVAFRAILGVPHLILVGGPSFALTFGATWGWDQDWFSWGGAGVLGLVAGVCAVIAWFAIMFANSHPRGLWDLGHFYLRWRVRALPYMMLLQDQYPPFGESPSENRLNVEYPEVARDKLSVGLRLIYLIPHWFLLFFLWIGWCVTAVIAWFAILFTGRYPERLQDFAVGVMRWSIRVETYQLLMRDEYPPFSLD